jgi:hypothetical protein
MATNAMPRTAKKIFSREINSITILAIQITVMSDRELQMLIELAKAKLKNGRFLFNISGVNLRKARKGFGGYQEAEENSQVTEWELFMILRNRDYQKNCIFHNGKTAFKKTILWKSITG